MAAQLKYGKTKNFINGQLVDSASEKWIDVSSPLNVEVIYQVAISTNDD